MKMIGHETVRQDTHRNTLRCMAKQIEEGLMNVTKMINDSADSMSQITANMGKRMSV